MSSADKKIHGDGSFVSGSVRVVDYNSYFNNILVRGSSAFGASNFVMSDLITAIKADPNFAATNITLNPNPMVIDFCLIGFGVGSKDERIVDAEMKWFSDTPPSINGNVGPYPSYIPASKEGITSGTTMVYWPIQALGSPLLTKVGATWDPSPAHSIGAGSDGTGFNYQNLILAIWNALQNQTANIPNLPSSVSAIKDAIIYVHCDSGVNRTGAAVAGYLLTFGSNVAQMNLKSTNGVPYTLAQAQTAANSAPPSNDSPVGGVDIPVTQAYCNLIYTKDIDGKLIQACLPLGSD